MLTNQDSTLWAHIFVQMLAFGVLFPLGMVLGVSRSVRRMSKSDMATDNQESMACSITSPCDGARAPGVCAWPPPRRQTVHIVQRTRESRDPHLLPHGWAGYPRHLPEATLGKGHPRPNPPRDPSRPQHQRKGVPAHGMGTNVVWWDYRAGLLPG